MLSRSVLLVPVLLLLGPTARAQFVVDDHLDLFGVDDFVITPDGRFAVGRENSQLTTMWIHDLVQGGPAVRYEADQSAIGGPVQDAVAVTNERAFLIGSQLVIADLTTPGTSLIAKHDVGVWPRDLALTPNGLLLAVRGGHGAAPGAGGLFVFDAVGGALLASHPGEPSPFFQSQHTFDVDSVVASDRWAVMSSYLEPSPGQYATRVSVWDLAPAAGPPVVVFETSAANDLEGVPHDLSMAPDGSFVAVRAEFEVGLIDLSGSVPALAWKRPLFNQPGPFGNSAMDSIEVTNERIATLSRWSNGGFGAQVDVFDRAGNQFYQILFGDPHDLAITPSGERLVLRTHTQVVLYDILNLPTVGNQLSLLDFALLPASHTSWGAGMDSIVASETHAVACARVDETTTITVYDIRADQLDPILVHTMPSRPIDLELSPDTRTVWITGFTHVLAIDLRARAVVFEHVPTTGGGYPWCDGVAVGAGHAVAFGYRVDPPPGSQLPSNSGWVSILDTFRQPAAFCPATINSSGTVTELFATGSARASANDLELWAAGAPPGVFAAFQYGNLAPPPAPFGDGFLCVGGQLARFAVVAVNADGIAHQVVDNQALPVGGGLLSPGSTWNFQFIHRDSPAVGAGWNLSQGLAIPFEH